VDASGNLFIADTENQRIRKVSTSGIITTVAGTGTKGFSGDGGLSAVAMLANPSGVAVDVSGNLYIADTINFRIRKVSAGGIITTVAGTGTEGFSGDGGSATSARLSTVSGLAMDAVGNLFIADTGNSRIRKVSAGGTITTVAGTATGGFSGDGGLAPLAQLRVPYGVAVDLSGNLFIADTGNQRIRKVSGSGIITTVAGNGTEGLSGDGGLATAAQLTGPFGVAADGVGNLFIADTENNRIRRVSASGIMTTIAGSNIQKFAGDSGPAIDAVLNGPIGISPDTQGSVFFSEASGSQIRRLIMPPQGTAGCQYAIDQVQQVFTAGGGSASLGVLVSASTCPWLAVSFANWVTISGGAAGIGSGLVTYSVLPNPYSAGRKGLIGMGGVFLTVVQSGLTCSLDVQTRSVSVGAAGVTGASMNLNFSAPDCQWNATTNVPWILLGSGSNGTGGR